MESRQTTSFDMLLLAQDLLIDGEALYQSRCLGIEKEWTALPVCKPLAIRSFLLQFSAGDIALVDADLLGAIRAMKFM